MRPRFITFEGGEGCGKTTQLRRLSARLETLGQSVFTLREPGGTPLGEVIRDLLKHHPAGLGMSAEAELLLFAASRAELVRKTIQPALAEGRWVVCDRFLDSTTVYQGRARKLPPETVEAVNRLAVASTLPGLTLVLDLAPERALARAHARVASSAMPDRMESEPALFYHEVREGFRALADRHPGRIKLIPADGSEDAIAEAIWKETTDAFPDLLA
jgi:dTMP kinase